MGLWETIKSGVESAVTRYQEAKAESVARDAARKFDQVITQQGHEIFVDWCEYAPRVNARFEDLSRPDKIDPKRYRQQIDLFLQTFFRNPHFRVTGVDVTDAAGNVTPLAVQNFCKQAALQRGAIADFRN